MHQCLSLKLRKVPTSIFRWGTWPCMTLELFAEVSRKYNIQFFLNLMEHELFNAEIEVLCRGLKYGLPPKLEMEKLLAEFEIGYEQLEMREVVSEKAAQICKRELAALAEDYAYSKVDRIGFPLNTHHLERFHCSIVAVSL